MENDWQGRATRESAAILTEVGVTGAGAVSVGYDVLVSLMAIAWLQGVSLGTHETMHEAEGAFQRLRVAVTE
jgi:hypothetical protein